MKYHLAGFSGAVALLAVLCPFGHAEATYGLTGTLINSTATTETWRITLSIDTSGYTGAGVAISAVAVKISSHTIGSELSVAPAGASAWSLVPGGLSSGGCAGSGSGFNCADWVSSGPGVLLSQGPLFSWSFDQTIAAGSLFDGPLAASIKAEYVDAQGRKTGELISRNATLEVPEPSFVLLFGIGLLAVSLLVIFRRNP